MVWANSEEQQKGPRRGNQGSRGGENSTGYSGCSREEAQKGSVEIARPWICFWSGRVRRGLMLSPIPRRRLHAQECSGGAKNRVRQRADHYLRACDWLGSASVPT